MLTRRKTRQGLNGQRERSPTTADDTDCEAMLKAMMNPIVLDRVFSSLSIPDLKSARLVCQTWNTQGGARAVRKNTFLNLKKTWPCCNLFRPRPPPFHPNLAKRIKITDKCSCPQKAIKTSKQIGHQNKLDKAFFRNLPTFVALIHGSVEEMILFASHHFLAELPRMMYSHKFSNLKYLCITPTHSSGNNVTVLDLQNKILLPSLISFTVNIKCRFADSRLPIQQFVLDMAPNLETVILPIGERPSFKKCPKVKILHYDHKGDMDQMERAVEYVDIDEIVAMLEPIKNSLINLKLWVGSGTKRDDQNVYNLPQLPNLTSLSLHCYQDKSPIHGFLRPEICPNLKHISLRMTDVGDTLPASIGTFWQNQMKNIESLDLKYLHRSGYWNISKIVEIFPSVKKFNLELKMRVLVFDSDEDISTHGGAQGVWKSRLREELKALQVWKLDPANVKIFVVRDVNHVKAVLEGMSAWSGKKTVAFNRNFSNYDSDPVEKTFTMTDAYSFSECFERVEFRGFDTCYDPRGDAMMKAFAEGRPRDKNLVVDRKESL